LFQANLIEKFYFSSHNSEEPELDPLLIDSWEMDPTAGSLAVGPSQYVAGIWFSISAGDISTQDCCTTIRIQLTKADHLKTKWVIKPERWC